MTECFLARLVNLIRRHCSDDDLRILAEDKRATFGQVTDVLASLDQSGVTVVKPLETMCAARECVSQIDRQFLFSGCFASPKEHALLAVVTKSLPPGILGLAEVTPARTIPKAFGQERWAESCSRGSRQRSAHARGDLLNRRSHHQRCGSAAFRANRKSGPAISRRQDPRRAKAIQREQTLRQ